MILLKTSSKHWLRRTNAFVGWGTGDAGFTFAVSMARYVLFHDWEVIPGAALPKCHPLFVGGGDWWATVLNQSKRFTVVGCLNFGCDDGTL